MVSSPQAGQIGNQHAFLRYNIQAGTQQDRIHSCGMLRNEPGNSVSKVCIRFVLPTAILFDPLLMPRHERKRGGKEGGRGRKAAALRLRKGSRMNESLSFPKRRKVASAENSSKLSQTDVFLLSRHDLIQINIQKSKMETLKSNH